MLGRVNVGRYPFGINLSADDRTLFVTHVGVFQYTHLRPETPTGDNNVDYPLCYPGAGYPEETRNDRVIAITKVDPRNLPDSLRDADGIRCGYVPNDRRYTVPGLGSPNAPESSSVYVIDVSTPQSPAAREIVKTGPRVGQRDNGIAVYSGSHPNSVVVSSEAIFVANGNNDSISVLDPRSYEERDRIDLTLLRGRDRVLKGVQPVGLALSPDESYLYVAEAGINAIGVIRLNGRHGHLIGHIPTGWWPSAVRVSADGKSLYVANARGRGAGPNPVGRKPIAEVHRARHREPDSHSERSTGWTCSRRASTRTTALPTTSATMAMAGSSFGRRKEPANPIPDQAGKPSAQIKHVIFINKENATHDLLLGDITTTRRGVPVDGEPSFSLGYDASPNHHELALRFAFSDNFFLEPSVSSDGHRWLTEQYTAEFEETHWPASYGGGRRTLVTTRRSSGPSRAGSASPTPTRRPNPTTTTSTAASTCTWIATAAASSTSGTATSSRSSTNRAAPSRPALVSTPTCLWKRWCATTATTCSRPTTPTSLTRRCPRIRRGSTASTASSRCSSRSTSIAQKGVCKLPHYVDLYYPNDHGGGAVTSIRTGRTGRSSGSCRTTTPRSV